MRPGGRRSERVKRSSTPPTRPRETASDQAMLYLAFAAGLRVSELVGLRLDDLEARGRPSDVARPGERPRQRRLPLWKEATRAVRAWLALRGIARVPEVFVNARGDVLSCSGFTYLVKKYARAATPQSPGLSAKRISPHVLEGSDAVQAVRLSRPLCGSLREFCTHFLRESRGDLQSDGTQQEIEVVDDALIEPIERVALVRREPSVSRNGREQAGGERRVHALEELQEDEADAIAVWLEPVPPGVRDTGDESFGAQL
jgi:hypothetical protein